MVLHYLFIGLGGALGAMSRVALGVLIPPFVSGFPIQILCINVLGCLSIGLLTETLALYSWFPSTNMRSFLVPGFLGGFTTFSSFALEFGLLYKEGAYFLAILYALLSMLLSLGAFFAGLKIIRLL